MKKAFYYPPASRLGYDNPYSVNYKNALSKNFYVCDSQNKPSQMLTLRFLLYSFYADVFFVNWLESAPFLKCGRIQFLMAYLALIVIKVRKRKIVWMLHNIHPHNGSNARSLFLQKRLFSDSSLIVTHSKEAFLYVQKKSNRKCLFFNHPVKKINLCQYEGKKRKVDVLIWGSILPYKGVYEFLSNPAVKKLDLDILVIGSCRDEKLVSKITSCCSEKIHFENRRASFEELKSIMENCKYVLFPYVGDCVSSSGALIDTLVLGGTPVGPNVGAFLDLSKYGVCLTYCNFFELMELLHSEQQISEENKENFINQNSWENFIQQVIANI